MTHPKAAVNTTPQRTELGLFPSEWVIAPLSELEPFVTSGSRGWAAFYSEHGDLFVRITNLSRESIYLNLDDCKFVKLAQRSGEGVRTRLQEHDVLISITADIGIVGYVDSAVPSPAYINQHIALVRFDANKTCGKFVSYFLASERPQRLFRAATDTGAKAGMSLPAVLKIQTAVPPLREQRAIAEALGDVDTLLAGLDRLIAKKRDLKQAAMQQLLTGQTRLPGFDGPWKAAELNLLCSMKSGEGITSEHIDQSSTYPCYGGNGIRGFTSRFTHEGSYVLIGRQGALCGNVVVANGRFFASEHAVVVSARAAVDVRWLAHVLKRMNLNQYSESSAQPGLSVSKILKLSVGCPPTEAEQSAIAAVLADMDDELGVLETRLNKTRALKQAMMQELLTGRIRLI